MSNSVGRAERPRTPPRPDQNNESQARRQPASRPSKTGAAPFSLRTAKHFGHSHRSEPASCDDGHDRADSADADSESSRALLSDRLVTRGGSGEDSRQEDNGETEPLPEIVDRALPSSDASTAALVSSRVDAAAVLANLGQQVVALCSEPAIRGLGNWEIQMPLNQEYFPKTTLHLSLSDSRVKLRFDAPDSHTKDVLLMYSEALQVLLKQTLLDYGQHLDVEVFAF
ncbi:type III secretion system protein SctP [Paraburkholderia humisilvae]|uniref:Uncharacterized protein n=1 Tax=Paraburkholderia humisilvae TaxID=627669 RepID=A0A6J5F3D4_9BURK|nr:type III secretion system protein SctP [Paraburkholderia humisilvae]CAB3772883.1 hypothetical protein LMG29542_07013 [Paraburkholderia humisilvae]